MTYGGGEREALAMAEGAIRLVIEDRLARGESVPEGEPPRIRRRATATVYVVWIPCLIP